MTWRIWQEEVEPGRSDYLVSSWASQQLQKRFCGVRGSACTRGCQTGKGLGYSTQWATGAGVLGESGHEPRDRFKISRGEDGGVSEDSDPQRKCSEWQQIELDHKKHSINRMQDQRQENEIWPRSSATLPASSSRDNNCQSKNTSATKGPKSTLTHPAPWPFHCPKQSVAKCMSERLLEWSIACKKNTKSNERRHLQKDDQSQASKQKFCRQASNVTETQDAPNPR